MIAEELPLVLTKFAMKAKEHGCAAMSVHPWALVLAYGSDGRWLLQAKLITQGSWARDWSLLGRITALLGASDDPPATFMTDPGGTHEWRWSDLS